MDRFQIIMMFHHRAPVNGDVLTWSSVDNNWYPADAIDINVIQRPANGKGTLVLDGNDIIYTPPYLEDFLTEDFVESDPFFRASPAADIRYIDISNWNTAHGWGDHAEAGYLKEVRLNDLDRCQCFQCKRRQSSEV